MKISMIGTGYVGLTTGTCLANLGNEVVCMDIDEEKIGKLKKGIIPIYEPGLKELVERNVKAGRLSFTTSMEEAVRGSEVIFIAVATPQAENGEADLKAVFAVAEVIGKHMNGYKVIVDKSTVPVGTADKVKEIINRSLKTKIDFDVVSNPEFLREGEAINDFMVPDRVVIGINGSEKAKEIMLTIYRGIERTGRPILMTDVRSAELIKYASNAMLSTRISFMNELSRLCDKVGADIKMVAKGIGLDSRIGPRFLHAGIGYGGSCFPKDVRALAGMMREKGIPSKILNAVDEVNEAQKQLMVSKITSVFGNSLKGKRFAVWGLSFKPKTDDMREAPSIKIITELKRLGAEVTAYDPVAMENSKRLISNISYADEPYGALKDADALLLLTEWDEFREPDLQRMKQLMRQHHIFDGRNVYEPADIRKAGFNYVGIGR